ncbi:MAG: serine hydrolase [Imperialibacter sp.]|uniref:serine hydrolase n=1 Tax=Imperialibacter sp. TaxID=2038411 RepID=UPI0032ED856E
MKKPTYLIFALTLTLAACQPSSKKQTLNELKQSIEADFEANTGDYAIAFKDLSNPDNQLYINEKEAFHAASTMKTPVMIELFKQARAGKFSLSDSILVVNEFKSIVDSSAYTMDIGEDSGEGLYSFIGQKLTIYDLTYEMITVSSNLATNILIELVGAPNVMTTMKSFGANDIQVLRGVEDQKAYELGMNNTTTAKELAIVMEMIATNKAGTPEDCAAMIRILEEQRFNEIIPAYLPDSVVVAHKTGSITKLHHDSGIVYLPDGRKYVLVLLSKNLNTIEEGTEVLARVSEKIYSNLNQ